MNTTRTFLIDLAERAGKTFLQTATAAAGVEFAGSGLSVGDLPTLAVGEKIAAAAVLAGLASVLSLLTSVVSGLRTQTASASVRVADSAPISNGSHTLASAGSVMAALVPSQATLTAPGLVPHVAIYNTPPAAPRSSLVESSAGPGLLDPSVDLNAGQQPVRPDPFMEGGGANPDNGGPAVNAPADPAALGGS